MQDQKTRNPAERQHDELTDFSRWQQELEGKAPLASSAQEDQNAARARDSLAQQESGATAPQATDSSQDIARREGQPSTGWQTNVGGSAGSKALNSAKNWLKKARNKWIVSTVIGMVFAGGAGGAGLVSLEIAHINDMWNGHAFRLMNKSHNTRMGKYRETKYFSNPDECRGGKIKCRFHKGLSDNEIKRLEQAGLRPEVGEANGKKYIKSFTVEDADGKLTKITKAEFLTHYLGNPKLVLALDNVAKPRSILTMGKETLRRVYIKFKLNATDPLGDGKGTSKDMEREMRKTLYSGEQSLDTKFSADETQDKAIKEYANDLVDDNVDFNKPVVPTIGIEDIDFSDVKAGEAVQEAAKGGVKGAIFSVAAVPDKVCSAYDLIRMVSVLAKVYKARALIKYAFLFMTIGSKMKAGEASPQEVGLMLSLAMTPSVARSSKGLNFFSSEGWFLFSQGKVRNKNALSRFVNGGALSDKLITVRKTIESIGSSAGLNVKQDCKFVKSTWGQVILGVVGIAVSVGSFGTATVIGIVGGAALSTTISVLEQYAIPMIASYAAGTVAPDPKDPEGGYGMGNAAAAGWQAFASETGKANGLRPMLKSEYAGGVKAAVEFETQMAAAENYGKNPFALDNPNSITNKLAVAVLPMFSSYNIAAQNGVLAALSPFNMLRGAAMPSIMATPALAANEDPYGSQYCEDEDVQTMQLATDAFCNVLYWESDNTLLSANFTPDAVNSFMVDNRHVDADTGTPISDDYKNYMADCVNDVTPLLADGGGVSIEETENSNGGDINTAQCRDTSEKYTMFRLYLQDTALDEGDTQGANGSFGKEETI